MSLPEILFRLRLRYRTKMRAPCWLLERLSADAEAPIDQRVLSSRRKTIRAVITRTIIDGTTDMGNPQFDCVSYESWRQVR
jgi:hypothetical protein